MKWPDFGVGVSQEGDPLRFRHGPHFMNEQRPRPIAYGIALCNKSPRGTVIRITTKSC